MLAGVLSDWITTLTLVFGGCCSNAVSLQQITSRYPESGTLITFFQFLLISLYGLPKQIIFAGSGPLKYPQLRPRKIPITPYLIQVILFYVVSLLNNAAFGYQIPMPVHIIFRSGGLIVSMLLGRIVVGKKYSIMQVLSVIAVTLGVGITTMSASKPKSIPSTAIPHLKPPIKFTASYAMGIIILSVALIFAGLLGLVQDWTYSHYGRTPQVANKESVNGSTEPSGKMNGSQSHKVEKRDEIPAWQESLFYLHFLAMPMFLLVWQDLSSQFRAVHSGPRVNIPLTLSAIQQSNPWLSYSLVQKHFTQEVHPSFSIPTAYFPLLLNTFTQLLCASGVHRLTGKVSSLSVTLTLVVRKAVSLVISVLLYGGDGKGNVKMWIGAAMVMAGTVGYSMGGKKSPPQGLVVLEGHSKVKAE